MLTALHRLRMIVPALLLASIAACGTGSHTASPVLHGRAGETSASWPTLTDATFGFSLRYPPGWTEKFDQPAGFHALASRADMTNLLELQGGDFWLVAQATARDPSAGCGEPADGPVDRAATTLGGLPATRYVVAGTRGDATQHIIDVIAVRSGTCYTLQLVAGGAISLDRAMTTLQAIQDSYRLTG
jgi:hypothetical protein